MNPQPSRVQVMAALETIAAAGFSISPPAADRLALLSVKRVAQLLEVGEDKARAIVRDLPGSVILPGGDVRARVADVERYLDSHPLVPSVNLKA